MISLNNVTLFVFDGSGTITDKMIKIVDHCKQKIKFEKIVFLTSVETLPNESNIKFHSIKKTSHSEYNKFLVTDLNNYIETDYCMTIHPDGYICNPEKWTDEFLNYDYIGAPWWRSVTTNQNPWIYADSYSRSGLSSSQGIVGNGGFSIRSKKLLRLLSSLDRKYVDNFLDSSENKQVVIGEDLFTCIILYDYLNENGCKIAPLEVARKFSIEQKAKEDCSIEDVFGFHGSLVLPEIENYLKRTANDR